MANQLNKLTVAITFSIPTIMCIYYLVRQKSILVKFFLVFAVVALWCFYFYLINNENFPN